MKTRTSVGLLVLLVLGIATWRVFRSTRADGSFELTGVPAGLLPLWIHADGYHTRIESGPTAREGAALGPITIALTRVGAGEPAGLELVGIGIGFGADGDALQISWVRPGASAADAGVQTGDRLLAIDGVPVEALGVDGAVAAIRGQPGTTVTLTLQRDGQLVQLAVERRLLRT